MLELDDMKLLDLVKKGIEADKILNSNKPNSKISFEDFLMVKSDSNLGKKAEDILCEKYYSYAEAITNGMMSNNSSMRDKINVDKVKSSNNNFNKERLVRLYENGLNKKEDFYSTARMSLLKAIRNYDSTKGSSLKSYIFYSVVHGLINLANEGQEYSITERCRLKRLNELQEEYAYMHENLTDDIIIEELELKSKKELIHILSLQKSMNKIRIDDEENSIDILDDDKKKETINTINEMLFGLNEIESAVVKAETNIKYFDDKKMVCEKYNLSEEKYNEILNDSRKKLEKVLRKD